MNLESIQWVDNSPRVTVKPTSEKGTFIVTAGLKSMTGNRITMYDVRRPEALAAELGDITQLRSYVFPTDPENGKYHFVGSCVLTDDSGTLRGFADSEVYELG